MRNVARKIPAPLVAYIVAVALCVEFVPVGIVAVCTTFLGLAGQSVFVLLYATRPWQYERFTRALMLKSVTLWLLFLIGAIRVSVTGRPAINSGDPEWLAGFVIAGNVLIIAAVWYQAVALFIEIRKGWFDEMRRHDEAAAERS